MDKKTIQYTILVLLEICFIYLINIKIINGSIQAKQTLKKANSGVNSAKKIIIYKKEEKNKKTLTDISNNFMKKNNTESLTLGDLFVLDRLFSSKNNHILNPDKTDLGDILILNQLFNENNDLLK